MENAFQKSTTENSFVHRCLFMCLASVLYCLSDLGAFSRYFPSILVEKNYIPYVKQFSNMTDNTQFRFR